MPNKPHSLLHRLFYRILKSAYYIAITLIAAWVILVALFAPILSEAIRNCCAAGLAFLYLLFLIRPGIFAVPAIATLLAAIFFWNQITASNDKNWQTDVAQLPWVEQNGDELTFHNVRDFHYRTETDFDPAYVSKKVHLSELSSVDLFTSYWSGKNIAHVFVSFGFADKEFIAISIEARKTKDQAYSTLGGFFRNFNLTYIVAEERDVVALRTLYRQPNEEVYLLRGRFNRPRNTKFLLQYISKMNALRDKAQFYNSLTTNCTTTVLANAEPGNPTLKYNWRILLPGHTPEYLYMNGTLDTSLPLKEIMQKGFVNPRSQDVSDPYLFSRNIRQGVSRPGAIVP